jgi:hypothetical protein
MIIIHSIHSFIIRFALSQTINDEIVHTCLHALVDAGILALFNSHSSDLIPPTIITPETVVHFVADENDFQDAFRRGYRIERSDEDSAPFLVLEEDRADDLPAGTGTASCNASSVAASAPAHSLSTKAAGHEKPLSATSLRLIVPDRVRKAVLNPYMPIEATVDFAADSSMMIL